MSAEEKKTSGPAPSPAPAQPSARVERSGSGADTALVAMLRKRQMRAGREQESAPCEPGPPKKDSGTD